MIVERFGHEGTTYAFTPPIDTAGYTPTTLAEVVAFGTPAGETLRELIASGTDPLLLGVTIEAAAHQLRGSMHSQRDHLLTFLNTLLQGKHTTTVA